MGISTSSHDGATANGLPDSEADVEARPLPSRPILSPVGSPEYGRESSHAVGSKFAESQLSTSDLAPVLLQWRTLVSPGAGSRGRGTLREPPKSVSLIGEWDPAHPVPMTMESQSTESGGRGIVLTYSCRVFLPAGTHSFYFDVDGRPELASNLPVENSRNIILVSPPTGAARTTTSSRHIEFAPRSLPHSDKSRFGSPENEIRSITIGPSSSSGTAPNQMRMRHDVTQAASVPVGMPFQPSLDSDHASSSPSGIANYRSNHGPRGSVASPAGISNSPHPSAVAKMFYNRYDPDNDGWGQKVPEFPRDQLQPSPSKGSAPQKASGPPELPVYLERALLNSGPVADDSSILPLPPRSMLNHVYERPSTLEMQHMILGLTTRYRDKFVTIVMYKPLDEIHSKGSDYHNSPSSGFHFPDGSLLGD